MFREQEHRENVKKESFDRWILHVHEQVCAELRKPNCRYEKILEQAISDGIARLTPFQNFFQRQACTDAIYRACEDGLRARQRELFCDLERKWSKSALQNRIEKERISGKEDPQILEEISHDIYQDFAKYPTIIQGNHDAHILQNRLRNILLCQKDKESNHSSRKRNKDSELL